MTGLTGYFVFVLNSAAQDGRVAPLVMLVPDDDAPGATDRLRAHIGRVKGRIRDLGMYWEAVAGGASEPRPSRSQKDGPGMR